MLVGLIIAIQLYNPDLNLYSIYHVRRIRPLHTNAVIFFPLMVIFAGVTHCKCAKQECGMIN